MTTRTSLCFLLALTFLVTACAPAKSVSVAVPNPDYWPTAAWRTSAPEDQGMDSALLAKMLEDASSSGTGIHSVLVIRNGYLVTEAYFQPYTRDTKTHIQSVTKSVIGMLVGKAMSDGYLKNVDQRLVDFYRDRHFENPSRQKDSIQLKHLLSMSSGFDCQEVTSSGPSMEQTQGWVQYVLDLPMAAAPGKVFGYCDGNPHLLSAILQQTTGISALEFANRELFGPLGIPPVPESDWGTDPQGITMGGYGLHLRPVDLAKLAFLALNNGRWEDKTLLPANWVADSTREYVKKEDGSGYGYLWTVYPESGHYAALGLGGQQIHVYPSKNLIVIVTGSLESYAEAPQIEKMLNEYILPAVKSDSLLQTNPEGFSRLQAVSEAVANPVRPIPALPLTALDISGSRYRFDENPLGWDELEFTFEPGAETAQLRLNADADIQIGLDNIYRESASEALGDLLLRGRWANEQTFVVDYPYPAGGMPILGELGETEFRFRFVEDKLEVTIQQDVFGGPPLVIEGSR